MADIRPDHHYQLSYDGEGGYYLSIWEADRVEPALRTKNDMTFFKLEPIEGLRCGLTKVVLKGTLLARYSSLITFPIADIEIAISIPWFIRG